LGFINKKKKLIDEEIEPIYPNPVSEEFFYKIREELWQNPELINDYLSSVNPGTEKTELLKSWYKHHLKGMFLVMEYKPEYAILAGVDEKQEGKLYGIKGISRPLTDALQYRLPVQIDTVLLPFKDKIIFDSFITTMNIEFGVNTKKTLYKMYNIILKKGIITRFN